MDFYLNIKRKKIILMYVCMYASCALISCDTIAIIPLVMFTNGSIDFVNRNSDFSVYAVYNAITVAAVGKSTAKR